MAVVIFIYICIIIIHAYAVIMWQLSEVVISQLCDSYVDIALE